jgi:hypothetical protein
MGQLNIKNIDEILSKKYTIDNLIFDAIWNTSGFAPTLLLKAMVGSKVVAKIFVNTYVNVKGKVNIAYYWYKSPLFKTEGKEIFKIDVGVLQSTGISKWLNEHIITRGK